MKALVVVAVLAAAASAAGLGTYYVQVGRDLDSIHARLVTPEQLEQPDAPETKRAIEAAPAICAWVYDLRANPIARRLRGDEIRGLWAHCERVADIASGLDKLRRRHP